MIVRGPIAAAMAWASARKSLPTGMRRTSSPSHSAALLKAGWAVCGTTICGRSMAGRLTRAQSRADLTAQEDALGAARRHGAARSGAAMQQPERQLPRRRFEPGQARKRLGGRGPFSEKNFR